MVKKTFTIVASTVLALSLTACGGTSTPAEKTQPPTDKKDSTSASQPQATDKKVTLNLATPDPDTSSITVAAKEFAKVVNEKSKGSIEVKVFANGTLFNGDPSAAVKQLGAGSLDMLALSSSLYANFQPKFNVISIPYLFNDINQVKDYINKDPGQKLLATLDPMGIKGLGMWTRNFRQITNSKRPITQPKDLEGIRLRVPNNPLWVDFFKATGTVTTPMAFSEVYNALQLGTIDGQENPSDIPVNSKFYEVQKYLTISNHMADAWVVAMNKNKFSQLSPDQQKAIEDATKEIQDWKLKYDTEQESKDVEFLKGKGMQVNKLTPDQLKAFQTIAQQQFPKFKELVKDDAFYDETLKFVGKAK